MRFLSLFAGIGGFDLGLERAGHECVGQVEIDGFCQQVLAERFSIPASDQRSFAGRARDIRTVGDGGLPRELRDSTTSGIDLFCGGFPCQDLSVAGKRAGLAGSRSGLFWEIIRIQKIVKAPWGLFENVPGLLSSGGGADMLTVLQGLRECWPAVGYRILDSRYFGVAQRRRRVFFVCGPSEASVRAVLFEPKGGGRNSQESEETAASLTARTGKGPGSDCPDGAVIPVQYVEQWGRDKRQNGVGIGQAGDPSFTLDASYPHGVMGTLREHVRPGSNADLSVVHSLRAEGHDASEDGMGRGTPIVATLNSGGNDGGFRTEPGEHLVSYGWNKSSSQSMAVDAESCEALQASPTSNPAVGVRRLAPLECERLQGFPDGWTCLCQPLAAYRDDPDEASLRCKCPDSPRYRALGNAVTVNVIQWLGKQLAGAECTAFQERRG